MPKTRDVILVSSSLFGLIVGGVFAYNKYKSIREIFETTTIVSDSEFTLSDERKKFHLLDEWPTPASDDPTKLVMNSENSERGGVCVTILFCGSVVTITCSSPEWRNNRLYTRRLFEVMLYERLVAQKKICASDDEFREKIRRALSVHV